jgi:hypothetical protein
MKEGWKGCLRNRRRIGHRIGAHRTIAGMPGAFVLDLGQIHTSCGSKALPNARLQLDLTLMQISNWVSFLSVAWAVSDFPFSGSLHFRFVRMILPGVGWFNSVKRNPIGGMGGWIN